MIKTINAFLFRDLQSEMSYRLSFLLQVVGIFPVVFMFYFLSRLFEGAAYSLLLIYGGRYFPFVLIGIAVQNYFVFALTSFSAGIREAQLSGTLEAVLSTPVRLPVFLVGSTLYAFVFNSLRIALYLGFGSLISGGGFKGDNLPAVFLVIAFSILAFCSMGIFSACFILLFKKGDPLGWFFSVVSWFLGGVYYPISVLPESLQKLSAFIPMTHSLEALRVLLLGQGNLISISGSLFSLTAWAVAGLPVSYFCFVYAVKRGRIKGNLGHY